MCLPSTHPVWVISGKIIKNMKLIEAAKAGPEQQLMLTDEKSLWGADIYIDISKEVQGAQMATISEVVYLTNTWCL